MNRNGWPVPDHRPRFHVQPPANWSNDPNGPLFWRGRYHLFYQYNPGAPSFGTISWGHAISPDLVHWSQLPVALSPTPGGPDEAGCWSGCAVVHDGVPTLIYTGIRRAGDRKVETVSVATGEGERLLAWHKDGANPVIPGPPDGLDLGEFRDPCVWREDGRWWCVLGGSRRGTGGLALLYSSPDLRHWAYEGVLCAASGSADGQPVPRPHAEEVPDPSDTIWECPQFFRLGDRHVLLIALCDTRRAFYTVCYVGTYRDRRFTPEHAARFDLGPEFYAPSAMLDPHGRRLVWGWVREGRPQSAIDAAGWAGAISLPRVLALRPDGALGVDPLPELAGLRGRHLQWRDMVLAAGSPVALAALQGAYLEIDARINLGAADAIALRLRRSPGEEEYTEIRFDRRAGSIVIDRARASLGAAFAGVHGGTLQLADDEPLALHIFLDGSIVEVFANGRVALTGRSYPARQDSLGVSLHAEGGAARALSIDAWEMGSIWPGGEHGDPMAGAAIAEAHG